MASKALYRRDRTFWVVEVLHRGKSRVKIRKLSDGSIRWVAPRTVAFGHIA